MAVLDFVKDVIEASDNDKLTLGVSWIYQRPSIPLTITFCWINCITMDSAVFLMHGFQITFRIEDNMLTIIIQLRRCEKVTCGVPQGSILGPLLFILYMNDICNTSKLLSFILFADDTPVFLSDKDVNVLYDTMNNELYEVCNWFKCNKLSLNASKTNLMLLGTAYKTKNANVSHSIHLDGCQLTRITNTKFLGMTIDENLTWKPHIAKKLCSRNLGVLNKVMYYLPKN